MKHGPESWEWVNTLGCWIGRDRYGVLWYAYPLAPSYHEARRTA